MAATGRRFEITEAQLLSNANFDELEVPQDYIATLVEVDDYDSGDAETPKPGWKWTFIVEGLPFTEWTAFATAARWKIVQLMDGFEHSLTEGLNDINPSDFIGQEVGVGVDWDPPDDKWDGQSTRYKRIARFFPLVDLEDIEALAGVEVTITELDTADVGPDETNISGPTADDVEVL